MTTSPAVSDPPSHSRRPAPRAVDTDVAAEHLAADWLVFLGYRDAERTPTGPDSGLDVISTDAVAQAKFQGQVTSRGKLQQLVGAAQGRHTFFFTYAGYSKPARKYADEQGIALFQYALQGDVRPVNEQAAAALRRAGLTDVVVVEQVKVEPLVPRQGSVIASWGEVALGMLLCLLAVAAIVAAVDHWVGRTAGLMVLLVLTLPLGVVGLREVVDHRRWCRAAVAETRRQRGQN